MGLQSLLKTVDLEIEPIFCVF